MVLKADHAIVPVGRPTGSYKGTRHFGAQGFACHSSGDLLSDKAPTHCAILELYVSRFFSFSKYSTLPLDATPMTALDLSTFLLETGSTAPRLSGLLVNSVLHISQQP